MPLMANQEHLKILKQGVKVWNDWRQENGTAFVDLSGANLNGIDLSYANFAIGNFQNIQLNNANLFAVNFFLAALNGGNLANSHLSRADFENAFLVDVDFTAANLGSVNFNYAHLSRANFTNSEIIYTIFADNDLSEVKGLDNVRHMGPSTIGIDTLYKSGGRIPESFLRGCGVPDEFIAYIPSLIGARQAIEYYSCFISYSSKDEEFARRLYSRMRDEHLRVWFAPEELKGGEKLREQIDRAIQVHDRLLIVLSEHSLCSRWVETEIRRAHSTEVREKRRKLFPIRLVGYERLQAWECFDSDTGEDLAREVREYYIPDFTNWKEHDSFETEFAKLLKALRAAEGKAGS